MNGVKLQSAGRRNAKAGFGHLVQLLSPRRNCIKEAASHFVVDEAQTGNKTALRHKAGGKVGLNSSQ